jgi:hypothetical protein
VAPLPTPPVRMASSTLVDATRILHECLELQVRRLALRCIPQRACPFADELVISSTAARAANYDSKWISTLVKQQIRKSECMPQQPFGPSPYFEVHNDGEYGLQIIIYSGRRPEMVQ